MLFVPIVLHNIELLPIAVFLAPVVLDTKLQHPNAELSAPVVLLLNEWKPTAVLLDAVLHCRAFLPTATLALPAVLQYKA